MIVTFKGVDYDCPEYTKFIAVDRDGDVFAYDKEPHTGDVLASIVPSTGWNTSAQWCRVYPAKVKEWYNELYQVS